MLAGNGNLAEKLLVIVHVGFDLFIFRRPLFMNTIFDVTNMNCSMQTRIIIAWFMGEDFCRNGTLFPYFNQLVVENLKIASKYTCINRKPQTGNAMAYSFNSVVYYLNILSIFRVTTFRCELVAVEFWKQRKPIDSFHYLIPSPPRETVL